MIDQPVWNSEFMEKLVMLLEESARDKSEADAVEERRKCIFSEMVNKIDGSVSKAEHEARASAIYVQITEDMIEARTRANISAAKAKGMECRFEAWRSANATKRAEMQVR